MAYEDYDIDSLAVYLHQDPVKVRLMAERGQIPGRRVGGNWRFSRAEVHHWLEERLIGSDSEEAFRLETVLGRQANHTDDEYTIKALLPLEAVAVPLAARTKRSVISAMVDLAACTGWLWDPDGMVEAVIAREELFPTAVDGGLALMHPRRPMAAILGRPFIALGRTDKGIPFGDPGGGLTRLFFLILSVDDAGHLRTLARLGRVLSAPGTIQALKDAEDTVDALETLIRIEHELG